MKYKKLLLLPLLALVLAGCTPDPSSSGSSSEDTGPSVPEEVVPVRTIAEIRAMTADGATASAAQKLEKFETKGIVTAKFRGANISETSSPGWNISIQDDAVALLLYAIPEDTYAADFEKVNVGDELTVQGNLAAYGGLRELDKVKYISHKAATAVTPLVLTDISQAGFAGKDSALVKIDDLKVIAKPSLIAELVGTRSNITVDLKLAKSGTVTPVLTTYMHYNITMADAEATVAKLAAVKSTDTVSWTGVVGMNNGTFQMTNAKADEWTITAGAAPVLSSLAFDEEYIEIDMEEEVTPKLSTSPWDGPLTGAVYSSNEPTIASVNSSTGLITGVAAGEATITVTVGEIKASIGVEVLDPTVAPKKYSVKPLKADLGVDKNVELTTPELVTKHVKGLPTGTTLVQSKLFVSTGGGSSSTDSMDASLTVFKLGTSSVAAEFTFTFPVGTTIESVALKGRAWNTDDASLSVNGIVKSFKNDTPADKADVRSFNYYLSSLTNVVSFVSVKRVILTEMVFHLRPAAVENFGTAIPEGVTPIAELIEKDATTSTVYTTRGVVTGVNGGAIYLQDPISGKSIGLFTSNADFKLLAYPGYVLDVTGTYKINGNAKQLDPVTKVVQVAKHNLTKVEAVSVSSAAELTTLKAATDVNAHARLVKFVGVKIKSVEDGGTNRFKIVWADEAGQEVLVGFSDSSNLMGRNRTEVKALTTKLLADVTVFDLYAVQMVGGAAGTPTWTFGTPTTEYFVLPAVA